MNNFYFKKAFTLSEILITLGIIGIVAAMTIPNLMTAYKKHEIETKLKKAVSTINQAVKMSEAENGEMESWDKNLDQISFLKQYISPYLKISQYCVGQGSCGYENKNTVWRYANGTYNLYANPFYNNRVLFITTDGILFAFTFLNAGTRVEFDNDKVIIIDINAARKPNQFGKDIFFLYRIEEKDSIIPYGADKGQNEIQNDCNNNNRGIYCAALIRQHGWKIPKNYPVKL